LTRKNDTALKNCFVHLSKGLQLLQSAHNIDELLTVDCAIKLTSYTDKTD